MTNKVTLNSILEGQVGILPTIYLGMLLGAKSKSKEIWSSVIERSEKKLARWKGQYLSLGGRVTLFNLVLDALPTYMISVSYSCRDYQQVDRIRRKFYGKETKIGKSIILSNGLTC